MEIKIKTKINRKDLFINIYNSIDSLNKTNTLSFDNLLQIYKETEISLDTFLFYYSAIIKEPRNISVIDLYNFLKPYDND